MLPNSLDELMNSKCIMLMLQRHRERAEYTNLKLNNAGFNNIEFFEGVDGFQADLEDISKKLGIRILDRIFIEKGSTGFTLSCILIWKKIIEENLPYLVVFEDDALPHPAFKDIAQTWFSKTDKDIDLLYMGSQCDVMTNEYVIEAPCFCTHAYVITNNGAKKLMNYVYTESKIGSGVDKGDCLIIQMQWKKLLNYRVWNIKGVNYTLPFKVQSPSNELKEDAIW